MSEGYPNGLIGQNDADRRFHPLLFTIATNETMEAGVEVFQALKDACPDFIPKGFIADGALAFTNAYIEVYGTSENNAEQKMCFAHVWKVIVIGNAS